MNITECFFNFPFSGKQASRVPFSSEKNKMDNSQNGYSSVEKTGKIKKIVLPMQKDWLQTFMHLWVFFDSFSTFLVELINFIVLFR